jgi:hypothetical protein
VVTRESAALSAWYGSRPEIRRLWALRNTQGLRVLVHVERALDSNEIHPAWMANRDVWIDELQLRTGSSVRLEHMDEPLGDEVVTDVPGVIVAALSWRPLVEV